MVSPNGSEGSPVVNVGCLIICILVFIFIAMALGAGISGMAHLIF